MAEELEDKSNAGVTDDELNAAFEELGEEKEPVKEAEKETPAQEPEEKHVVVGEEDNAEKSRLGRKLKAMEEERAKDREMLQLILAKLDKPATSQSEPEHDDEDEFPETITTPDDIEKYLRVKEKKQQEAVTQYQSAYKSEIMKNASDEDFAAIMGLIRVNPEFDKIYTGKPDRDAELNYAKAAKSYYKGLASSVVKKEVPVKGDQNDELPTGLSGSDRKTTPNKPSVELDDFAKEAVAKWGMTPEQIETALKGDTPLNLKSRA